MNFGRLTVVWNVNATLLMKPGFLLEIITVIYFPRPTFWASNFFNYFRNLNQSFVITKTHWRKVFRLPNGKLFKLNKLWKIHCKVAGKLNKTTLSENTWEVNACEKFCKFTVPASSMIAFWVFEWLWNANCV